jgi:hypothetical protein
MADGGPFYTLEVSPVNKLGIETFLHAHNGEFVKLCTLKKNDLILHSYPSEWFAHTIKNKNVTDILLLRDIGGNLKTFAFLSAPILPDPRPDPPPAAECVVLCGSWNRRVEALTNKQTAANTAAALQRRADTGRDVGKRAAAVKGEAAVQSAVLSRRDLSNIQAKKKAAEEVVARSTEFIKSGMQIVHEEREKIARARGYKKMNLTAANADLSQKVWQPIGFRVDEEAKKKQDEDNVARAAAGEAKDLTVPMTKSLVPTSAPAAAPAAAGQGPPGGRRRKTRKPRKPRRKTRKARN